jgi:hypothetical protein
MPEEDEGAMKAIALPLSYPRRELLVACLALSSPK